MTDPHKLAASLSEAMRSMLRRSRSDGFSKPPRCYGPANTKKALRDRGLGHGDFCYLTPTGEAVRAALIEEAGNG